MDVACLESLDLAATNDDKLLAAATRAYEDGLRALSRSGAVADLTDLLAQTAAVERYLRGVLRSRKVWLQVQNLMAELRLRVEHALGRWLSAHVNHTGGGDRRSGSRRATAVRDLPEGVTKSDSSRWQLLASLPESAFDHFVVTTRDARKEITTAAALKLAKSLRQNEVYRGMATPEETARDLEDLARSGARFATIYADPPWRYDNTQSNGAAGNHYPTMTAEAIAALPIKDLAAEDAHCHLWTTTSFLREAGHILSAWGFAYKSVFVWVKDGLGQRNAGAGPDRGTRSRIPLTPVGATSARGPGRGPRASSKAVTPF